MTVTFVEPDPDAGFNYPYYLRVPASEDRRDVGDAIPILVEPTCSGEPTDDFEHHLKVAQTRIHGGFTSRVADELGVPLVHPVFPRPASDPVDWTHYVHALDAETLTIDDGPLSRIDRQMLAMIEDARERLDAAEITTRDRFMLDGFSAAGTFANRFVALHPDRVLSVSAGGLNGMAILPTETIPDPAVIPPGLESVWDGTLPYPLGVADIDDLTGTPFDLVAFREIPQFLYQGGSDDADSLLYPDAWTEPTLRGAAVFTYGEDVHEERFPTCEAVYDEVGAATVFHTYEGVGHTPKPALADVIAFHRGVMAGEDVDSIRLDIEGGN